MNRPSGRHPRQHAPSLRSSVAVGLAVALAGVVVASPAAAAPSSVVPSSASTSPGSTSSVPTSVQVTGTSTTATVSWVAPTPRSRIVGYVVTTRRVTAHGSTTVSVVHAGQADRQATISPLRKGTQYWIGVRTRTTRGLSHSAAVTYATPATDTPTPTPTTHALYALDSTGAVVRRPVDGGPLTTVVPSGGAGFDVTSDGLVAMPTADHTGIRVVSPDGTSTTVVSGLAITGGLQLDGSDDAYFRQGSDIVEVDRATFRTRTVAPAADLFFVAPDGAVTTTGRDANGTVFVTTYPADGSAPFVRERAYSNGVRAVTGDANGTIWVDEFQAGASGAVVWQQYPVGATDPVAVGTRVADDAGAVGAAGDFSLLPSAKWCAAPSEASGSCKPDLTVPERFTRHADGTTSSVSISGLSIAGGRTTGGNLGVTDAAGDVFVNVPSGPTSGLYEVPAVGGPVQRIDAGQFSGLMVV